MTVMEHSTEDITSVAEQARLATLTPVEYVKELNAADRAWAAANPGGTVFYLTEDPAHWEGYANGLEAAFGLARSAYSDAHKDVYGFRPRGVRFESLEGVERALTALYAYAEEVGTFSRP